MSEPKQRNLVLLLSAFSLLAPLLPSGPANAAPAPETASLTVSFTGLSKPGGAIMAGVFDSREAFDGDRPVQGVRIPVTGASASQTITGLKPGRYAIKAYHDVNGDGRMNTNPFGMPTEPYAASNNAPSRMGPPAWADAVIDLVAGDNVHTIRID
jgi:uncharacterized protein (DUF2141 family)